MPASLTHFNQLKERGSPDLPWHNIAVSTDARLSETNYRVIPEETDADPETEYYVRLHPDAPAQTLDDILSELETENTPTEPVVTSSQSD